MSSMICTIGECTRPLYCKKMCQMHYSRMRRNGDPEIYLLLPPKERFWNKVDKAGPDECWMWKPGSWCRAGHGQMYWNGQMRLAHRLAWMFTFGEMPTGKVVRHLCNIPLCVNPTHLAVGTVADNNVDQSHWNKAARLLIAQHSDEFKGFLSQVRAEASL